MWRRTLIAIGLVALTACDHRDAPRSAAPATTALPANGTVEHVVDGDTLIVAIGGAPVTVRLIGIDTPETVKPEAPVECYGPEASARTAALLPAGTAVRVVRDEEPRDAYGRLLGYVYRASDGLFVNLALVAEGFAEPYPFEPNTAHREELTEAARTAERDGLGLWGACGGGRQSRSIRVPVPSPPPQHIEISP